MRKKKILSGSEKIYRHFKYLPCWTCEFKVAPNEYWVGFTRYLGEDTGSKVTRGTDHVWETHEKGTPLSINHHQLRMSICDRQLTAMPNIKVQMNAPTKPSTVFFGLSLIKGVLPNILPATVSGLLDMNMVKLTADICHYIVTDDQRCRDEEPYETLEDIIDNKMAMSISKLYTHAQIVLTSTRPPKAD